MTSSTVVPKLLTSAGSINLYVSATQLAPKHHPGLHWRHTYQSQDEDQSHFIIYFWGEWYCYTEETDTGYVTLCMWRVSNTLDPSRFWSIILPVCRLFLSHITRQPVYKYRDSKVKFSFVWIWDIDMWHRSCCYCVQISETCKELKEMDTSQAGDVSFPTTAENDRKNYYLRWENDRKLLHESEECQDDNHKHKVNEQKSGKEYY